MGSRPIIPSSASSRSSPAPIGSQRPRVSAASTCRPSPWRSAARASAGKGPSESTCAGFRAEDCGRRPGAKVGAKSNPHCSAAAAAGPGQHSSFAAESCTNSSARACACQGQGRRIILSASARASARSAAARADQHTCDTPGGGAKKRANALSGSGGAHRSARTCPG